MGDAVNNLKKKVVKITLYLLPLEGISLTVNEAKSIVALLIP
jgi:archaellum component FlaF (FlaF/FlaG flagellin family)